MKTQWNALGQRVGFPLPDWSPRARPPKSELLGRFCRLAPLDPERHARELFEADSGDKEGRDWTYLPRGPYPSFDLYRLWAEEAAKKEDPLVYAIIESESGCAVGVASYMRIDPPNGVIEVGGIHLSPRLKRRAAATEAMYLMMRRVFDELQYRRYEWKCDALNAASRAAALRLGFRYEGLFRQASVYKGRNRDTAWFSVIDREWPELRAAFEGWLDPANFDVEGRQRTPLTAWRAIVRRERALPRR
jgi:RimJ/RimL family protein N-acetyltransferase